MSLSNSLESMKDFNISDLDFNNAGSWPAPVKLICCISLIALVLGAVYWFDINDLNLDLERRQAEELDLRKQFEGKAAQVSNLEEYKAQMAEMKKTFGDLLKQLPSDTEVPGLLEDISSIGSLSGLELSSIDLRPEISKEFYVELPIDIKVSGGYHDLASFVSGVAGLSRIVTLHNFNIKSVKSGDVLSMDIQAKTYRYNGGGAK
ncbi:pilus assembly protein PilP [Hahella sp. KA22]|uniref:type 4a pilus biogenesis protein PilO n=1 Tax=Hahella sp. KA22 TaxID=1628392 RepID=UPI000FDEC188|nr:type 4a pilus biogenesis protein PilO [Hahella sp. KA22]AZZ94398.1 pilus assembly protein PilP [Hahella sp. KA22]QAY57772.1 pilus assembly protein PilP [Hahella sp. KA22]